MTLSNMAFNPADGLRDKTVYPTDPITEDALRDAVQKGMDQLRDDRNNNIMPEVNGKINKAGDKMTGNLTINTAATRLNLDRQSGSTDTFAGISIYDAGVYQGSKDLFYNYSIGRWQIASDVIGVILSGGYRFQSGSVSVNAYGGVAITFPAAFSYAPLVFPVTATSGSGATAQPYNVTATGFTLSGAANSAQTYYWFAIGT